MALLCIMVGAHPVRPALYLWNPVSAGRTRRTRPRQRDAPPRNLFRQISDWRALLDQVVNKRLTTV